MGIRFGDSKKAVLSTYIDNYGIYSIALYNRTGGASVAGEFVKVSTSYDLSVESCVANDANCIGAFGEGSIADTELAWINVAIVSLAKADSGGFTVGQWVGTGATAKLADGDATPGAVAQHFQERGHALETATSGQVKRIITHNL